MQGGGRSVIVNAAVSIIIVISGASLWGAGLQGAQRTRLMKADARSFFVAAAGLLLMVQLFPKSIGASWGILFRNSRSKEFQVRTPAADRRSYPLWRIYKRPS